METFKNIQRIALIGGTIGSAYLLYELYDVVDAYDFRSVWELEQGPTDLLLEKLMSPLALLVCN
jgi:hypothetical protein